MRKFIVSDLHGNLNIYCSIINYLENLSKDDELILYINGDLIDRGRFSFKMLLDIKNRIENKKSFDIKYLAGNHELMMYQTALKMKNGIWPRLSNWYSNGGLVTLNSMQALLNLKEQVQIIKFISELDVYHKFKEKLDGEQIVLVHARCPKDVNDICDLKLKDNNANVSKALWTREEDLSFILKESLGNKDYFTIIGHTPVYDEKGYTYDSEYKCLNIDGGCAAYAIGRFEFNHTPLVEIDENNNRLIILTFNNSNEIINANYFTEKKSVKLSNNELDEKKKYIEKNIRRKKLEYM